MTISFGTSKKGEENPTREPGGVEFETSRKKNPERAADPIGQKADEGSSGEDPGAVELNPLEDQKKKAG